MGSIPVRVTKTKGHQKVSFLFWCPVPQSARDKNALRFYPMGSKHCSVLSCGKLVRRSKFPYIHHPIGWCFFCSGDSYEESHPATYVAGFAYRLWRYLASFVVPDRRIANSRTAGPWSCFSFLCPSVIEHSTNTHCVYRAMGSKHCLAVSCGDLVKRGKFPYLIPPNRVVFLFWRSVRGISPLWVLPLALRFVLFDV